MKNGVGRNIPDDLRPFVSSDDYKTKERRLIPKKKRQSKTVFFNDLASAFDHFGISSGSTISFHHHLRNGDHVLEDVCEIIDQRNLRNIHLAPSSIFPSYTNLVKLIENQNVTDIHTNYVNGPVAKAISLGKLAGKLVMDTHGGRARAIESGDLKIDYAFLACPVVDKQGNGTGAFGKSACGTLGYAVSDLEYAGKVILVTDSLVDKLDEFQLNGEYVDAVVVLDSIGDSEGIISGTTQLTKDPIGLKIAKDCSMLLDDLGMIENGFSMQTGAGKTSLAVVKYVKELMERKGVKGSFGSGGITKSYVEMLEQGLFDKLYDVQCFDLDAVESFHKNKNHLAMSASEYGNPFEKDPVCDRLSFVILGAAEIDLDFNVNVTTDSLGNLIGGSGGHADIAKGADLTIIISPLIKSRIPLIKDEVMTVTTPGSDIDILITERGIAINPLRKDLLKKLQNRPLPVYTIKELYDLAHSITGKPRKIETTDEIVGFVEYRDGTIIDCIYKTKVF